MITVLSTRKITRFFKYLPYFHIYEESKRPNGWSLDDNKEWLKDAFDRGDWFLIINTGGEILKKEIQWLNEFRNLTTCKI